MGTDRRMFLSSMAAGFAGAALAQATGRAWAQGTKTKPGPQDVLLVIDVQNCFTPGGSLAVKDGDAIVPLINRLAGGFQHVVLTQDWHTPGHVSFASSHPGKKPFETTSLPYGTQVLWPDHCIQGTDGANLHKDLKIPHASLIIRKGHRQHMDSYSAFYEADGKTPTGLTGYLRDRGLTQVYLCGLATDFCVGWSAVDARKAGFGAAVIEDACRGIDVGGSLAKAWTDMQAAGVGGCTLPTSTAQQDAGKARRLLRKVQLRGGALDCTLNVERTTPARSAGYRGAASQLDLFEHSAEFFSSLLAELDARLEVPGELTYTRPPYLGIDHANRSRAFSEEGRRPARLSSPLAITSSEPMADVIHRGQLTLTRLTKRYSSATAVDAIDLVVEQRGVPHAPRPERLRQNDDPHDGRRLHPALGGRDFNR